MPLPYLPTEIKILIAKYVSIESLPDLRLADKSWDGIVEKVLYKAVFMESILCLLETGGKHRLNTIRELHIRDNDVTIHPKIKDRGWNFDLPHLVKIVVDAHVIVLSPKVKYVADFLQDTVKEISCDKAAPDWPFLQLIVAKCPNLEELSLPAEIPLGILDNVSITQFEEDFLDKLPSLKRIFLFNRVSGDDHVFQVIDGENVDDHPRTVFEELILGCQIDVYQLQRGHSENHHAGHFDMSSEAVRSLIEFTMGGKLDHDMQDKDCNVMSAISRFENLTSDTLESLSKTSIAPDEVFMVVYSRLTELERIEIRDARARCALHVRTSTTNLDRE